MRNWRKEISPYYNFKMRGRTLMNNPEPQPIPKEVCKYVYNNFGPGPESYNQFRVYKKDPYTEHNQYLGDNFMFQYNG